MCLCLSKFMEKMDGKEDKAMSTRILEVGL